MTLEVLVQLLDMTIKLVLAVLLGGVIGFEREVHGRPAGLRTHILVCLGATTFTIVSISFAGSSTDPSRIASQVVTGIGFLGAGTIIRQGSIIRGLTTAASLWTVAAIGVAVGVGGLLFYLAIIGTGVVFTTLGVITRIEDRLLATRRPSELIVNGRGPQEQICDIIEAVQTAGAQITSIRTEPTEESDRRIYRLRLRIPHNVQPSAVLDSVSRVEGVLAFEWD